MSQGKGVSYRGFTMSSLILIRHGQSVWNASNRFTGWTDVDLSEKGVLEAEQAGRERSTFRSDIVHTSDLIRAQSTAEIIMRFNEYSEGADTKYDWRLNERNYGSLQGLNKAETAEKHGADLHGHHYSASDQSEQIIQKSPRVRDLSIGSAAPIPR